EPTLHGEGHDLGHPVVGLDALEDVQSRGGKPAAQGLKDAAAAHDQLGRAGSLVGGLGLAAGARSLFDLRRLGSALGLVCLVIGPVLSLGSGPLALEGAASLTSAADGR